MKKYLITGLIVFVAACTDKDKTQGNGPSPNNQPLQVSDFTNFVEDESAQLPQLSSNFCDRKLDPRIKETMVFEYHSEEVETFSSKAEVTKKGTILKLKEKLYEFIEFQNYSGLNQDGYSDTTIESVLAPLPSMLRVNPNRFTFQHINSISNEIMGKRCIYVSSEKQSPTLQQIGFWSLKSGQQLLTEVYYQSATHNWDCVDGKTSYVEETWSYHSPELPLVSGADTSYLDYNNAIAVKQIARDNDKVIAWNKHSIRSIENYKPQLLADACEGGDPSQANVPKEDGPQEKVTDSEKVDPHSGFTYEELVDKLKSLAEQKYHLKIYHDEKLTTEDLLFFYNTLGMVKLDRVSTQQVELTVSSSATNQHRKVPFDANLENLQAHLDFLGFEADLPFNLMCDLSEQISSPSEITKTTKELKKATDTFSPQALACFKSIDLGRLNICGEKARSNPQLIVDSLNKLASIPNDSNKVTVVAGPYLEKIVDLDPEILNTIAKALVAAESKLPRGLTIRLTNWYNTHWDSSELTFYIKSDEESIMMQDFEKVLLEVLLP